MAVLVISSGLGIYGGTLNQRTQTSISTTTASTAVTAIEPVTTTATSFSTLTLPQLTTTVRQEVNVTLAVPFPSLQLTARISPQNISLGQNVSIIAEVYNSLPETVALEAAPISDPSEAWCPFTSPTAVALYSGFYGFSNLTGAVYLLQYNGSYQGACSTLPSAIGYTFQPDSDLAVLQQMPPNTLRLPPLTVNRTISLEGYWGNAAGEVSAFQPFRPGQYTVLVSDAWGQETLCYFTVA